MKRFIFLLSLLLSALASISQSRYYLRADSVYIEKGGGNGELILLNSTRDSIGGVLYNKGGGRTGFRKAKVLNDSMITVGGDTLIIRGKGGFNLANSTLTANDDYTHNWAQKQLYIDSIPRLRLMGYGPDSNFPTNIHTQSFEMNSATNGTPLELKWFLRNTDNNQDSIGFQILSEKNSTILQHSGANGSRLSYIEIIGNNANPRLSMQTYDGVKSSTLTVGNTTTIAPADNLNLPNLVNRTDTATYKPIVIDGSGNVHKMVGWPGGGGSTPDLQAVTDVDNKTTNDIIVGSRTNSVGRFSVEKTFTALNVHAFDDYSTLNPSSGGFGFGVFDASTTMIGSQTNDHLIAHQSRLTVDGSANIDGAYGLTGLLVFNHHIGSGTVANAHGILIKNTDGSGPLTTQYGLRIEPITHGTNKFSIRSEGGKNSFVDEVMIGGHTTPIAKLDVRNSSHDQTLYVDNTKANGIAAIFNASNGSGSNVGLDVTAGGGAGNKGINFASSMGVNDWNIYSSGLSKTYLAGRVGLNITTPVWGLDVQRTIGANKDSVNLQSTIGTRQMLVIDTANGKFQRMNIPGAPTDQVHTSGTAVTINDNVTRLFVDPPSALASLAVTFPTTPYDGQVVKIFFGGSSLPNIGDPVVTGGISAWINPGGTAGIIVESASTPMPITAGMCYVFEYRASNTYWYQVKNQL